MKQNALCSPEHKTYTLRNIAQYTCTTQINTQYKYSVAYIAFAFDPHIGKFSEEYAELSMHDGNAVCYAHYHHIHSNDELVTTLSEHMLRSLKRVSPTLFTPSMLQMAETFRNSDTLLVSSMTAQEASISLADVVHRKFDILNELKDSAYTSNMHQALLPQEQSEQMMYETGAQCAQDVNYIRLLFTYNDNNDPCIAIDTLRLNMPYGSIFHYNIGPIKVESLHSIINVTCAKLQITYALQTAETTKHAILSHSIEAHRPALYYAYCAGAALSLCVSTACIALVWHYFPSRFLKTIQKKLLAYLPLKERRRH